MASTLSQGYRNLPANCTESSTLKRLLDDDLEHRSFILCRKEEVQTEYTHAKKAAEAFTVCLATASAAKDAYAASILSTNALENALKNALNIYDNHLDSLATIPSATGMLVTWAETLVLTKALLTNLDKVTPQVEAHLHLVAEEHAAHESAHIAASGSILSCTDSLHAVDRGIAQKKGTLFGLRSLPTEILSRMFIETVEARQHEIVTSLSSYYEPGSSYHDLNANFKTLNLVPFTLSATCERWRAICQSTPRLWRYARVPMAISTSQGNKITGKTQFERCVLLSQKQPLDLTVYPCYDVARHRAAFLDLVPPAESQTLRVNIVWHNNYAVAPGVPSPTELYIVASDNSQEAYTQVLPTQLLAKTKTLRCSGLTPRIHSTVGIQTLHISHSKSEALLPSREFGELLRNCPQLEELHLENEGYRPITSHNTPLTHQQLHTLSLTGVALPWVIDAFAAGCHFPHLSRLVLTVTNMNGLNSGSHSWSPPHSISDQVSLFTHIEVLVASEPVVAQLRPLFEASTALQTLTLVDSAVEPMLRMLTLSAPKRVRELRLNDSNANGTTLRDYLAAIEKDGGGTSGMQVVWNSCPNLLGEYGGAFGELHL
jgi:hypothetical protein